MSSKIEINVGYINNPPRYEASYDEEAGIICIESDSSNEWSLGLDIDGTIVFDADKNGIMMNCDIIVPRSAWVHSSGYSWPPSNSISNGTIAFSNDSIQTKSFHMSPRVFWNSLHRMAVAVFSNDSEFSSFLQLSDSIIAGIRGETLEGWLLRL